MDRNTAIGRLVERALVVALAAGLSYIVNSPDLGNIVAAGSLPYLLLHTVVDLLDRSIDNFPTKE